MAVIFQELLAPDLFVMVYLKVKKQLMQRLNAIKLKNPKYWYSVAKTI